MSTEPNHSKPHPKRKNFDVARYTTRQAQIEAVARDLAASYECICNLELRLKELKTQIIHVGHSLSNLRKRI